MTRASASVPARGEAATPATVEPASRVARSRSVTLSSIRTPSASTAARDVTPTSIHTSSSVAMRATSAGGRKLRKCVDGVATTPFRRTPSALTISTGCPTRYCVASGGPAGAV